ncbi:DMT family transporter [Cocleimonas sp. KMM 6892]|uniref:DMT family transporter n=1 Tax=unclassified Cocleimonas TaxID=2639732 RepID=UPI002DBAC22C|nr:MULTISPECIES: DMT family transporter [unclassified Cocleimonas]MEB8432121.1 DMT family transporter [Cocleimonas sp. KMM 6892]MEC4714793.1 DMT family transporter [Cocleimonas sp. KMM 6895]MEC4744393.1 DMT family transporter [Cocleimonas sp. KMM 6896]
MQNNTDKTDFSAYFILLLPPLFWSGNFVVGRAVADAHAPLGLSFSRWLLAFFLLLPFIIKPIWQQRHIIKAHFWGLVLLAFLSITCFNSIAYVALQYTTATNATLLNSFIPIFIFVISGVFFKEKINVKQVLGVLVSLLGVIAIITRLDIEVLQHLTINKGDLWMLLAALVWALYSILLKYLRPKEMSAMAFLGTLIIIGTIILYPVTLWNPLNEPDITWNSEMLKAVFYIAIFPSIIAYLSWNYGLNKIGAAKGGQYIHLMPFFGAILAIVFLGETIQLFHLVGGCCIAMGLWLSLSKAR